MAEIGKYIYGIINSNTTFRFFIPRDFLEGEKSEPNGVYAIPYQDISAIVSDSRVIDTSTSLSINPERAESLDSARDGSRDGEQVEPRVERVDYTHLRKDALARLLVAHQRVIERFISLEYAVIPMRLGTFAVDEDEVKEVLNRGYGLIKDIIGKINDKIELDVVATWSDFPSVLKEMGEEKEIKELKERLLGNPKGITVDDRMKVGFMVKKALEGRRESYAFQIKDALEIFCDDLKQHELMDDKMVINLSFLIDKAKQKEFYARVEDLNKEFAEKLNFRCVGPLPPYSFYTLEIKKMKFKEIDWARKRLGLLNEFISKDEIKKAYQASAFSSHPDKNPDTPGIEKDFDDVVKAYKLLLEYSWSCEQTGQGSLSFNEEEFKKDAILVKVRE